MQTCIVCDKTWTESELCNADVCPQCRQHLAVPTPPAEPPFAENRMDEPAHHNALDDLS